MKKNHSNTSDFGDAQQTSQQYWHNEVSLKHLYCMSTDWHSVRRSMTNIANSLATNPLFEKFSALEEFWGEGDIDRANQLLDKLYDFCDERRIWVK